MIAGLAASEIHATDSLRIMLVEDSPAEARLISELLRTAGVPESRVVFAGSINEARERLSDLRSHGETPCMLLDLGLPDSEGVESVKTVRDLAPDVPIVVLTGSSDEATALRALEAGAHDYLVKSSVNPEQLGRALRYAVGRKRAQSDTVDQALLDPMTGIPNRTLLADRMSRALARARRRQGLVGVLFIDLDDFKVINDELGHPAGDAVLQVVARRLQDALRVEDTVARYGGDEFVVVCESLSGVEEAETIARRLHEKIAAPIGLSGSEHRVGASIGIALSRGSEIDEMSVIRAADEAMVQAKAEGRISELAPLPA